MIIYKITNLINNKIYIGQTRRSLRSRWLQHSNPNTSNKNGSRILRYAILKYRKENFKIEQIDEASTLKELNEKEYLWIENMNCIAPNGYNLVSGGNTAKEISEETRKKMSEAQKKRPSATKETRKKLSEANKGKKRTKEAKERYSKSKRGVLNPNYGKIYTKEERSIQSIKMSGKNGFNYGKKLSKKTRKKISEMRKNKCSDKLREALLKISRNNQKRILCINNNVKYGSIKEAAFDLKLDPSAIVKVAKNKLSQTKGYTFKYWKKDE